MQRILKLDTLSEKGQGRNENNNSAHSYLTSNLAWKNLLVGHFIDTTRKFQCCPELCDLSVESNVFFLFFFGVPDFVWVLKVSQNELTRYLGLTTSSGWQVVCTHNRLHTHLLVIVIFRISLWVRKQFTTRVMHPWSSNFFFGILSANYSCAFRLLFERSIWNVTVVFLTALPQAP